ncbi:MAG: HAMP domain-containing histidine kinase [Clostridia bacterium]|nr:HAMP domain-containing histidine kinase [Clostridia bacterium]
MRNSLFKRFYLMFLSAALASLLLLGSVVLAFSGNYWLQQNKNLLLSQGLTVAGQIEAAAMVYSGGQLSHYAQQMAAVIARSAQCQVLVVNASGMPIAQIGEQITPQTVPEELVQTHMEYSRTFVGKLDGCFHTTCVIAAVPITVNGHSGGVVYTAVPAGQVGGYMKDLLQLFLLAAAFMVAVMAAVAYVAASALTKPLVQMSTAAKGLANGDFSHRITVKGKDEIAQLAQSFNDMTLSLEAGEKMRKGFIANVSHELKSPMTTIAGFVDGILDGTVPAHRQKEYLAIVSGEVRRLSRLVNRMLSLSKLESGDITLSPKPMDLRETVTQSLFLFESAVNDKNITVQGLETIPPLPTMADPDLMGQVIRNLLENAVKYTPEGGWIALSGRREEHTVRLCIRNSGEGIAEADLPFVFDRFYKADASRGSDQNSLGLGLYLVKTIVSLHGGLITVRSAQNAYCEFELLLQEHTPDQEKEMPYGSESI